MAFMQSNTGGGEDFKTYVKYNAKAGRWYTKEDKPDAEEFEVRDMTAVFDFNSLKTGWFLFAAGVAPVKQLNDQLHAFPPRPAEGFKQGFQINLFSGKNLLGVREFASTAGVVIDAMNELHDAFEAASESKSGLLPLVRCVEVRAISGAHGTNYAPVFQIMQWVERPVELIEAAVSKAQAAPDDRARQPEPVGAGFGDDLDDDIPF